MQMEMAQRLLEKMGITQESLGSSKKRDRAFEAVMVLLNGADTVQKFNQVRAAASLEAYTEIVSQHFTPEELDRVIGIVSQPEWPKLMEIRDLVSGGRPAGLEKIGVPAMQKAADKTLAYAAEIGLNIGQEGCGDPDCPNCGGGSPDEGKGENDR